ncbi:hypothetical protein JMJ35_010745 [Cladonia borealis]|uniref:Uncharacterized protein n=1 Tax=Cladonia borealis TaxID=184061 RepID=A0AA39UX24_9LECA|nr:hypothetical protein JMJ35_010745 [Cladonia borealis]
MAATSHDKDSHDVRIFTDALRHMKTIIEIFIASCREPPCVYMLKAILDFSTSDPLILLPANRIGAKCLARDSNPGLKNFLYTHSVPNPNDNHYGFRSWDKFSTRKFLPGVRRVDNPQDSLVVVSATESVPFFIQENVQLNDSFWAKDQHYSLSHLLSDPKLAAQFVGGIVYQALLSADCYHN